MPAPAYAAAIPSRPDDEGRDRAPGTGGADALALPVAQPLGGDGAKIVDEKLGGRLSKLGESGELRGERGEAVLLHLNGELEAPRLVAAGVGKRDAVDADALRTAGAATAAGALPRRRNARLAARRVAARAAPRAGRGARRRDDPRRLLARPLEVGGRGTRTVERIVVGHADDAGAAGGRRAGRDRRRAGEPRARSLEHAAERARRPTRSREKAQELAHEHEHLTCEIARHPRDRRARHGRARRGRPRQPQRAAPDRPALRPARARATDIVLGLVGKSITFDAGGISIKPSGGMQDMKGDMSGGAGTLHGIGALAALGTPVRDDRRPRGGGEPPRRGRVPARRHPPRRERQDDRGHQHRRRGTARARRRALVRAARGSDARARPRDADGRDGARARRPLRRRLRERRRVARPDPRGRPRAAATSSGRSRSIPATAATSTRRSRT